MKRVFGMRTIMATGAVLTLGAGMAAAQHSPGDAGTLGQENIFNRVITVQPDTQRLYVHGGEIVKFIDARSGRSFVWNFNAPADTISISKIAPAGMFSESSVVIYRAPAWREISRD